MLCIFVSYERLGGDGWACARWKRARLEVTANGQKLVHGFHRFPFGFNCWCTKSTHTTFVIHKIKSLLVTKLVIVQRPMARHHQHLFS